MTLAELKQQLIDETVDDSFKIFLYEDNTFLVNQYINKLSNITSYTTNEIQSIYEPTNSALSLVLNFDAHLNILRVDKFEEVAQDYSQFKNIIVVCKDIDKNIKKVLNDYIIEFPKLEDWQIKAYIKTLCPGLAKEEIEFLYTNCKGNIYKIKNEADKINMFPLEEQHTVYTQLVFEKNSDIFDISIFDLADAITKINIAEGKVTLLNFYRHQNNFNYDPIAISHIVLNTLKKIALIKFNSGATADEINVSQKQYYAFKNYLYKNYNAEILIKAIKFISNIDLQLKSSELDLAPNRLLDYIICKFGACCF